MSLIHPARAVPYAELHAHSSYSFLDAASDPSELAEEAARLRLGALAVTDHDGMYGLARFAEAADAVGLATVFGAELSVDNPLPRTRAARAASEHADALATRTENRERHATPPEHGHNDSTCSGAATGCWPITTDGMPRRANRLRLSMQGKVPNPYDPAVLEPGWCQQDNGLHARPAGDAPSKSSHTSRERTAAVWARMGTASRSGPVPTVVSRRTRRRRPPCLRR